MKKKIQNKASSPYPLYLKKNSGNFETKIFGRFFQFQPKIFWSKTGRNFFFLLIKVGMGNKLYFQNFFHSLLKKFRPFSDFTFESEVLCFFSQGLRNQIFLTLVGFQNFFEVRFHLIMLFIGKKIFLYIFAGQSKMNVFFDQLETAVKLLPFGHKDFQNLAAFFAVV